MSLIFYFKRSNFEAFSCLVASKLNIFLKMLMVAYVHNIEYSTYQGGGGGGNPPPPLHFFNICALPKEHCIQYSLSCLLTFLLEMQQSYKLQTDYLEQ